MWRLVLYMLEDAKCDYRYTTKNGMNLQNVIAKKVRCSRKESRDAARF